MATARPHHASLPGGALRRHTPKVGAQCGNPARWDLCGGPPARAVPTATLRSLGEYQAASELDEDTLVRFRRVLGEDHPDTLRLASNLAADLRALDEAGDGV
ncbi:MAG: tetratricopeptide repeat protein [Streptosporangiaceae bacterium]